MGHWICSPTFISPFAGHGACRTPITIKISRLIRILSQELAANRLEALIFAEDSHLHPGARGKYVLSNRWGCLRTVWGPVLKRVLKPVWGREFQHQAAKVTLTKVIEQLVSGPLHSAVMALGKNA